LARLKDTGAKDMGEGSFFEVEPGVELYYEESGQGDPLVFVPGWTFTTEIFAHQFAHFSRTRRVVSFDPRGQGSSAVTLHGNDYATQSADLCKLIDHLNLKKPVLVGWSYGCLPVWGAVRLRGAKPFKGLVFIDMPPAPVTGEDDGWTEMSVAQAADFYQALTTAKGHRELVASYAQEAMVQRDLCAEELDWIVAQSTRSPPWVAAAYCAAGMFSNYSPEAQEVDRTLPALFVVAESSADKAKVYLNAHLPSAQVEAFGGHMMFWKYPKKFNRALETYLDGLD
jgi:pimeloyl-ACP methyl ester carboxylesterase